MMKTIKLGLTKIIGVALIGVGIIGLFLPFLQGILMILLGGTLLIGKRKTYRILAYFKKG